MTRETKIGLLVGLAFIIVIGILLSDHFTSTIQPPMADLTVADDVINRSIVSPGQGRVRERATVNVDAVRPDREIVAAPPANTQVQIDVGPSLRNSDPIVIEPPRPSTSTMEAVEITPPVRTTTPHAELTSIPDTVEIIPAPSIDRAQAVRSYKAEPGDTLSKMARRHLGADTESNREAITKLNPSLRDPPHRVMAGKTYNIPVTPSPRDASATAPRETVSLRETASREPVTASSAAPAPSTSTATEDSVYVTRPRDTLWRIAVEQVGSPSAVAAIKELNRDVLKNGDVVRPNMKLKLPPKHIAQVD